MCVLDGWLLRHAFRVPPFSFPSQSKRAAGESVETFSRLQYITADFFFRSALLTTLASLILWLYRRVSTIGKIVPHSKASSHDTPPRRNTWMRIRLNLQRGNQRDRINQKQRRCLSPFSNEMDLISNQSWLKTHDIVGMFICVDKFFKKEDDFKEKTGLMYIKSWRCFK